MGRPHDVGRIFVYRVVKIVKVIMEDIENNCEEPLRQEDGKGGLTQCKRRAQISSEDDGIHVLTQPLRGFWIDA
jgi:hypothetical protein